MVNLNLYPIFLACWYNTLTNAAKVTPEDPKAPVAFMAKQHQGATFLFAVGMRETASTANFTVAGLKGDTDVEVLGEGRRLTARDGVFSDRFEPWAVHLYRLGTEVKGGTR